jgi:hypothetical protein
MREKIMTMKVFYSQDIEQLVEKPLMAKPIEPLK